MTSPDMADFYQVKGKTVGLSGQAKTLAKSFGDEEAEHVAALTKAITASGGKPVKKPTFVFPIDNQASFLKLACVLEKHRRRGLQRRRTGADQQDASGGRGVDHADRGAPRCRDRGADQQVSHP